MAISSLAGSAAQVALPILQQLLQNLSGPALDGLNKGAGTVGQSVGDVLGRLGQACANKINGGGNGGGCGQQQVQMSCGGGKPCSFAGGQPSQCCRF